MTDLTWLFRTSAAVVDAYRTGDAELRQWLRTRYAGLRLEFEAVDRDEDRQQRMEAAHAR